MPSLRISRPISGLLIRRAALTLAPTLLSSCSASTRERTEWRPVQALKCTFQADDCPLKPRAALDERCTLPTHSRKQKFDASADPPSSPLPTCQCRQRQCRALRTDAAPLHFKTNKPPPVAPHRELCRLAQCLAERRKRFVQYGPFRSRISGFCSRRCLHCPCP